jgi:hypothetical protein
MTTSSYLKAVIATAVALCHLAASAQVVEASEDALKAAGPGKGVVLLDIYWARAWRCGRFENAQLRSLSFERTPLATAALDVKPSLAFESPSRLAPPAHFVPYAVIVEPGEYQMTGFEVGFARSVSDTGSNVEKRSDAIKDGKSILGSFTVGAGEVVYIGNFAVDCYGNPIPWRYYTKKPDFPGHLKQYKAKYPAVATESTVYRLFSTTELGQDPDAPPPSAKGAAPAASASSAP